MDPRNTITLASGATADGNYPAAGAQQVRGGDYQLMVDGTFNGATVTIEASHDNTNFTALPDGVFSSANVGSTLTLGKDVYVRAVISDSASPVPSLNVMLMPVREWS